MLEGLTIDTFSPLAGDVFIMHLHASQTVAVELTEASRLGSATSGRPFRLLFRGPRTPVAGQRIYRLDHPRLGTFELFLVPIGPDDHGMRYEAVFT